ncbi:MAG: xylulokinase [Flavisolibacter sp.]
MLLLGLDIGTSSIKASVVDADTGRVVASAIFPEEEAAIIAPKPGWAEQDPEQWWADARQAILKCHASGNYDPKEVVSIGIAYQMHGLVLVDKDQNVLRNSIIWCDGRAVATGEKAFAEMGEAYCLTNLLNAPGNFTASKLAWVKENEPEIYRKIDKVMLPGDFISMRLTGTITTSASALSEGIFWNFSNSGVDERLMKYFGFDEKLIPSVQPVFSTHGEVIERVAEELSLKVGIPVAYKAGDQPNNAFALQALEPGEVAATAGTSGVIYGISDQLAYDPHSRINSFAHVNHKAEEPRIGVLLCINGAGIFNRWSRDLVGRQYSYDTLNNMAAAIAPGSEGLMALPFGNGPERMLNNQTIGAHFHGIDLNLHTTAHFIRSTQESIAFAFRYGLDIMRENGMHPSVIRAGKTNMFLSSVFTEAFVNATGVPVELYNTDGSVGSALGGGVGAGIFKDAASAFSETVPLQTVEPENEDIYDELYFKWKKILDQHFNKKPKAIAM